MSRVRADESTAASAETVEAPARPSRGEEKGRSFAAQLLELPMLVLLAFVIAVAIKTFLVQAFFIPSGSMLPTLKVGDRVLVEKLSYLVDEPSVGDVVVFERSVAQAFGGGGTPPDLPWYQDARNFVRELLGLPTGRAEDYIKRVVAVDGDTITYSGTPRTLRVNGEVVPQPYLGPGGDTGSQAITRENCPRHMESTSSGCVVPKGKVFVMGDNRGNSQDSRYIGPIDEDKIVGRAFVTIWPPSDFSGL